MTQSGAVGNDLDGSHYVRSFGLDLSARFEDGEPLGQVHATMVRPYSEPDAQGHFENGEFWGLVEFYDKLGAERIARLLRGDPLRLEDPSEVSSLPVPSLVVQPVRDVRGGTGWLAVEIRE